MTTVRTYQLCQRALRLTWQGESRAKAQWHNIDEVETVLPHGFDAGFVPHFKP